MDAISTSYIAEHADDEGGVGECPELGSTGCLNDESSDDDAEHADDEGGVGECPELGSTGCLNDESSEWKENRGARFVLLRS